MNNTFLQNSKKILLWFLKEPGWFSFFPSPFFWADKIGKDKINLLYKEYFSSNYYNLLDSNNKLNLYIHIPFCNKICSYCNCFKKQITKKDEIDEYINYIEKEIISISNINGNNKIIINSIFIWGWTPNLLSVNQFSRLYEIINKYFDLKNLEQFLIDGHPNYYSKEKFDFLKQIWVTRLTFAIQTFNEKVLLLNNRDSYKKDFFEENISYLKQIWIKSNVDLLIWLLWQDLESIKNDIDYLSDLELDNISVHYFMNSNNLNYKIPINYLNLVKETKEYLKQINLAHFSSNILEDNYASKRASTIWIWAQSITNLYSWIIYKNPNINSYYKSLDLNSSINYKWYILSKRDEMIKFIYLNILNSININTFFDLFWEDIFKVFAFEMKFLIQSWIIDKKEDYIFSKKTDLETLIYLNIFFREKFSEFELNNYNESEIYEFFLENWELIDK